MKLANFARKSKPSVIQLGCIVADRCVDVTRAVARGLIHFPGAANTIEDVLHVEDGLGRLAEQLFKAGELRGQLTECSIALYEAKIAAPILKPQKLIGIGFNYR